MKAKIFLAFWEVILLVWSGWTFSGTFDHSTKFWPWLFPAILFVYAGVRITLFLIFLEDYLNDKKGKKAEILTQNIASLEKVIGESVNHDLLTAGRELAVAGVRVEFLEGDEGKDVLRINIPDYFWQIEDTKMLAVSLLTACKFFISNYEQRSKFGRSGCIRLCAEELSRIIVSRAKVSPSQAILLALNLARREGLMMGKIPDYMFSAF